MDFNTVIQFWFEEIPPEKWWKKDSQFDSLISDRFLELHQKAARSELFTWRETALGRLAEVIVLDQFSRNIFRDRPESFAQDPLALALAQEAVHQGFDQDLEEMQKMFLYMPYMHSESLAVHEQAVLLFGRTELKNQIKYEKMHKDIIDRFGRYPHRNKILGRTSTPEEVEFLNQPGSSF